MKLSENLLELSHLIFLSTIHYLKQLHCGCAGAGTGWSLAGIIIRGQSAMMAISRFIQNIPNFFGKDDGQKPHICCILGRIGKVYDKNILYSPWLDCIHHHLCCLIITIIIIVTVFRCPSSTRATAITLKSLNHHKSPVSRLKT